MASNEDKSKNEDINNNAPLIQNTNDNNDDDLNKPTEDPKRFLIVAVFFLLNFANGMAWITFASTADKYRTNYKLSRTQVDLLSMIFMIVYPIAAIPDSYIIDNVSVRLGLSLASITTIAGCFIRIFADKSYFYALIGQLVTSSFQPAIVNSPAKIASVWFKDDSRALVTSICCAANSIGVLLGYVFHSIFIDDKDEGEKYRDGFKIYLFWEFIVISILCVPCLIFMKNKPSIATSKSQEDYKPLALKENLLLLVKNGNFMKFLVCGALVIGFFNIIGTTLNHYLALYGLSDTEATITAGVANGIGLVACLVVSMILDKSKKFKKCMVILNIIGLVFFVIITFLMEITNKGRAYISVTLYSLIFSSVIPIYTTGMDYVAELTYPVGESYSGGLIMCSNQITGALGILLVDYLIDNFKDKKYLPNLMFCIMLAGSLFSILFIKEKLLRTEKEQSEFKDMENKDTDDINNEGLVRPSE